MKSFTFSIGLLWCCNVFCQPTDTGNVFQLPVFKPVSHPFMPTITSEYFYFSKDGLMWFSTAQGLSSFDGSEVVQYSTGNQAFSLGLNRIRSIAEDDQNNLYVGGDNRLTYFNRKNKTFSNLMYQRDSGKSFDIITRSLFIDKDGAVYIGTDARGLMIYNPVSKKFIQINLDAEKSDCWDDENLNTIASFAPHATDQNKLWLGTFNGIYLFDKVTKKLTRNFQVINPAINKYLKCPVLYDVRKMDVANDSTIWFSTSYSGFAKYNTRTGLTKLYLHNRRLNTKDLWKSYNLSEFAKLEPGKYILGVVDPSPALFDAGTEKSQLFQIANKPYTYENIQYVGNDRKGNVWIMSKGLLYVSLPDQYRLQTLSIKKQLTKDYLPNRLGDVYFDKATAHYYACITFSSGIYVLDTNLNIVKIIPAPLYTNKYTYRETSNEFLTRDGSGRFWTTDLETYVLQPGQAKFDYVEKVFPSLRWLRDQGEAWDVSATRSGDILLRFDSTVFQINHRTLVADSIKVPDNPWKSEKIVGTSKIMYDSSRNKLYLNSQKCISQYDLTTRKIIPLSYNLLFGVNDEAGQVIDYSIDIQGRLFSAHNRNSQVIEYALDDQGRIWVWIPSVGVRIIDPDKLVCVDSIASGTTGFITGNFNHIRYAGKDRMFFDGQSGIVIYNYRLKQSLLFDVSNGWNGELDYYKGYCNNYVFTSGQNQIQYFNLDNIKKVSYDLHPLLNTITAGAEVVFTRSADDERAEIKLPYYQNSLGFSFSASEFFFPERIEYAYQLGNTESGWQYVNSFNRKITYNGLSPGKYVFRLKAQLLGGNWQAAPIEYTIIIKPAFWQTWLFRVFVAVILIIAVVIFSRDRIHVIRTKAIRKAQHERKLLDLEAKALRAQMNPHFIFNCINSIKSLIQQDQNDNAIDYLTTFSKLIRTIFQNSDKREISLFDELETCRLYIQLESLRFGDKLSYSFTLDDTIDTKSIMVPALILQPFIENAIWHGLIPKKGGGNLTVRISRLQDKIHCVVEDDGIGRELSMKNKFTGDGSTHQSKGVRLSQSRLELSNVLNERNATVEIEDKKTVTGEPAGTRVTLIFDQE